MRDSTSTPEQTTSILRSPSQAMVTWWKPAGCARYFDRRRPSSWTRIYATSLAPQLSTSADVMAVIAKDGFRIAAAGVAAGLVVAWVLRRLVAGMLFGGADLVGTVLGPKNGFELTEEHLTL